MKRRAILLAAVFVALSFVVAPAVTLAQVPVPANHEHLSELQWLVGKWAHRGQTADARPLLVVRSFEWALSGHYMTCLTTIRVGNQVVVVRRHMVGWDSAKERLASWIFSSDGEYAHGVWQDAVGNRRTGKVRGLCADAKPISATVTYLRDSGDLDVDTFIYRAEERTIDGQPQPDIVWKFTRLPAGN